MLSGSEFSSWLPNFTVLVPTSSLFFSPQTCSSKANSFLTMPLGINPGSHLIQRFWEKDFYLACLLSHPTIISPARIRESYSQIYLLRNRFIYALCTFMHVIFFNKNGIFFGSTVVSYLVLLR